jgi:hypothetical protein
MLEMHVIVKKIKENNNNKILQSIRAKNKNYKKVCFPKECSSI